METSEGFDDQASGWKQVKKKHRSNPKPPLHDWVEGFSRKQRSGNLKHYVSLRKKKSAQVSETQPFSGRKDSHVYDASNVTNPISFSTEDEAVDLYFDKCVVSQNNENLDSSGIGASLILSPIHKLDSTLEINEKDGSLPKFKWGDLDEGTLLNYGKASEDGYNFDGTKDQIEVPVKAGSSEELPSCVVPLLEKNITERETYEDIALPNPHSSSLNNIPTGETPKRVIEISSGLKEQIRGEKVVCQGNINSGSGVQNEGMLPESEDTCDRSGGNIAHTLNEDVTEKKLINLRTKSDCSDVHVAPYTEFTSYFGETIPSAKKIVPQKCGTETDGESTLGAPAEEPRDKKEELNSDDLLNADNVDSIDSDAASECKERFRERLWCFLFENLNRAVDELYLLCELECDLEQMKEASLVLEEAASDFRELKSRVDKFEKSKSSLTHGADSASVILQFDHRRPHALSWEVRRMTTSPRRAEILSSSLEAFRKIQQERISEHDKNTDLVSECHSCHFGAKDLSNLQIRPQKGGFMRDYKELKVKEKKHTAASDIQHSSKEKRNIDSSKSGYVGSKLPQKESSASCISGKSNKEVHGSGSEAEKLLKKKNKMLSESIVKKDIKSADSLKKHIPFPEREREKVHGISGRSLDAWKEKRNWEDILTSPYRVSSSFSYSPGLTRKSVERVRVLHDKLMSPEKKKKSSVDLKKEAEEKHARATRIRSQLENERVQKLQRTSEKLNRVNEWQTVRSNKLRESMFARHQRSESRHEAYLAQVVRRAGDETSKVNEVRFITSLNEENKKHILRKKLQDSELRRAEKLQVIKIKQKEDTAREEAVLERRRLIEVEKLQRLAETQRRKEEAQVRREEERKASTAAREAKAIEKRRKKEIRAKTRQEESELLAQKLAERLSESEQRRKFYLEQIRERASMDFRDQSSPLYRRFAVKDGQPLSKSISYDNGDDNHANGNGCTSGSGAVTNEALQHTLKRRIKKIRQRLMSLKHEFLEPSFGIESSSLGYRIAVGTARAKIGRWLQDLQKLRQARKEGAANFGLISAEMMKFLEGRDAELQASRQSGLIDFIASSLPATHSSKPEACQVTVCLLRLLRVALATQANKCYFLVQNLLPPIIPMLAAALENYIKMAASLNIPGSTNSSSSKTPIGNLESLSEIVDGFLWTVAAIIGLVNCNGCQLEMQDGLVELVIAYQIIHRLRDLFALYDRPQAEGSPFPSIILLGINLLTVLSSKFRGSSLVDWDSFLSGVIPRNHHGRTKLSGPVDLRASSGESSLDGKSPSPITGSLTDHLLDVPENRQLDATSDPQRTSSPTLISNKPGDIDDSTSYLQRVNTDPSLNSPRQDKNQYSVALTWGDENACVSNSPEQNIFWGCKSKQTAMFLLSAMADTGLACLPSMLTAVLLQANNRSTEQVTYLIGHLLASPLNQEFQIFHAILPLHCKSPYVLPSNFEEVATGVLKILNNLALLDLAFMQQMLARPDLKMELFHLMSFILSHCTNSWGVATDKIGTLLLESLSLLGYFALLHSENQAVLRWGKSPTILHKVCDLPFVFFTHPELMPILSSTLVAASYGCEQNKSVILQELSMDMLLQTLRSCKNSITTNHAMPTQNAAPADSSTESNQIGPERKAQADPSQKSNRNSSKSTRVLFQRGGCISVRGMTTRNQRDGKVGKLNEETHGVAVQSACQNSTLMLHHSFPVNFIDKVEQFFSAECDTSDGEFM